MFITFIYKIGSNKKTYYGKSYNTYISDDHEGLDGEVRNSLIEGINKFRKQNNKEPLDTKTKINIGILSLSSHEFIPTYSTDEEINCFDFYYDQDNKIYINGKLMTN